VAPRWAESQHLSTTASGRVVYTGVGCPPAPPGRNCRSPQDAPRKQPDLQGNVPMAPALTPSEEFVTRLCQQSFLRLWTHPIPIGKNGKELCDCLVVCGAHILIVSVKEESGRFGLRPANPATTRAADDLRPSENPQPVMRKVLGVSPEERHATVRVVGFERTHGHE
jgi:hypothetical protein